MPHDPLAPSFVQPPPQLGNQYDDDRPLRSYLARVLPPAVRAAVEPELAEMGELAGGELARLQLADRLNEPRLTRWNPWGERIDEIELIARAVPRLTSRDPATFWTSGQWMTETAGGSDVGRSETVARRDGEGWRLFGRKWFTSAVGSQMALTLARPEGAGPGGRGLALFYLETRDDRGRPNRLSVERLKDKLGTRKLPTAELILDGTPAVAVAGTADGVRAIVPMLNVTRTWNAVVAASSLRRGVALARDYARRRTAFGAPLAEMPLHLDTLAELQAEAEGALLLAFRVVELLGRAEAGELDPAGARLLRALTPLAKLTTARQAVAGASEALEAFGGAGYVEDTGLPVLLRDAQVLSIWEGTTNVLALDLLRAIAEAGPDGMATLVGEVERAAGGVAGRGGVSRTTDRPAAGELVAEARAAVEAAQHAAAWLAAATRRGRDEVEAGARRFALTLGRAVSLALLVEQARWSLETEQDARAAAAARRYAAAGIDLLADPDSEASRALALDEPLPVPVPTIG